MKIARVKITNLLGIRELEFEAGQFTEISGRNGSGKTSVLTAIKNVLEGGHDATLIRKGEERGEIVLVLDDGTNIRKRVTQKASPVTIEKNGVKADKPQSVLDALTDMLSVNPVDFLRAPKKQRVNVLLEALPMVADVTRLEEIIGHKPDIAFGSHALEAIDRVYKSVFDDRTGTNRAIREKRSTINQLESAIPTVGGQEISGDMDALLAQRDKVDADKTAELARIDGKLATFRTSSEQKRDSIRTSYEGEFNALRNQIAEIQSQIASKRNDMEADLEKERAAHAEVEGKAGKQKEITITRHAESRAPLDGQIKAIQQGQEVAARARVTRQTIATMEEEAAALEADATQQSTALQALEAYKSELLSQLPIDGLEVREGEIFRNGVPFDRLNSGQQVEIAVEIAKLRAGKLGVIAVDGIELLDGERYQAFRDQMEGTGLQMFVARVTDDAFNISTN